MIYGSRIGTSIASFFSIVFTVLFLSHGICLTNFIIKIFYEAGVCFEGPTDWTSI